MDNLDPPETAGGAVSNVPEFSVSELSFALKREIETAFPRVRVRGEISQPSFPRSGHCYFRLKDENAVIDGVAWKGTIPRLGIKIEEGLEVIATGKLTTYAGSSRYQIIVDRLELAGEGALLKLLEDRRKKLQAEGLFDPERKRELPFLPEVIGVVTSPTGAVIRDIMHRLNARFPRRVLLWPVAVQGEKAAAEIAAAITGFNNMGEKFPTPDLLIVARGGGSVEDLMAFNDEAVVRAVAASRIPVISAVGHETDTTLIDFASDMRAPTPTAAAELAVPVRAELLSQTLDFQRRMLACFTRGVEQRRRHLLQLARVLPRADQLFAAPRQRFDIAGDKLGKALLANVQKHRGRFHKADVLLRRKVLDNRIALGQERVGALAARAQRARDSRIAEARKHLDGLARLLSGVSYRSVLERGFALVRGDDGKVRRRAAALKSGENVSLSFADGEAQAVVGGTPRPPAAKPKKSPTDQGNLF